MILPKARVLAALFNPGNPSNLRFLEELGPRAGEMGMTILPIELKSPQGLDAAFSVIAAHQPDVLQVLGDSAIIDLSDRISALALAQNRPSFSSVSISMTACCPMAPRGGNSTPEPAIT